MDDIIKSPKLNIELKQSSKGIWYVGSLNINAESIEEFENLLLQASLKSKEQIQQLNSQSSKNNINANANIFLNPEEQKLFQNFRELRLLLAKQEGLPPYVIFHDFVLKRLSKEKPENNPALISIIGEKKFQKYGDLINELLGRYRK